MLINPNGSKKSKGVSGQIMKREMTELYPVIRCSLCFGQNYLSCMNKKLSFLPSSCGRTLSLYPTVILWRCFSGRWGQRGKKGRKTNCKSRSIFNLSFCSYVYLAEPGSKKLLFMLIL